MNFDYQTSKKKKKPRPVPGPGYTGNVCAWGCLKSWAKEWHTWWNKAVHHLSPSACMLCKLPTGVLWTIAVASAHYRLGQIRLCYLVPIKGLTSPVHGLQLLSLPVNVSIAQGSCPFYWLAFQAKDDLALLPGRLALPDQQPALNQGHEPLKCLWSARVRSHPTHCDSQ